MEIIITPSPAQASALAARILANTIISKPACVLGLATGRTMEGIYAELLRLYREEKFSFSKVSTFNLDEFIGLSSSHPGSYFSYMKQHLFDHADFRAKQLHIPNGKAEDLNAECSHYEESIKKMGGIDLQILGLGKVGHIGFNEPLSSLTSRTRTKTLMPESRAANLGYFTRIEDVPTRAITMGVGTILDSKRCLLVVTGKDKASILHKAVEGPVCAVVTATALQMHPRCIVVADEAAASELHFKSYYRWIFSHEPEWQDFQRFVDN